MEVYRIGNESSNFRENGAVSSPKVVIRNIEKTEALGDATPQFDSNLLRRVVEQIKNTFNMSDTRLHFRVNMSANSVVVEIVDSHTNAILKQIPSEEMQELKAKLQEITGALVDTKA